MACYISNSVDYVLLFWTSARLGTIFAPVLVVSLEDETLTEHYLSILNPNIVVVQSADAASKVDHHTRSHPDCLKLMTAPKEEHDAASPPWHHVSDAAGSSEPLAASELPVDATAMILSTSGTTGPPKACPLSNAFIQTELFQYMSMLDHLWSSDSRLMSLSGSHFAICYLGLCLTACNGASLLMVPRPWPEPEQLLEEMERFDCTHAWITSSGLYNIACAAADSPALKPTKLKTILTSGEILHGPKFAVIKEHLRPQTFLSLWGMTEGAPILGYSKQDIINTSKGPPVATPGRIVSVGREALPGATAKIVSLDGTCNNPLPRGEQGMLHVSSQGLIKGYLDGRGADDFYIDANGKQWFKTGDLSMMDAEGYIYVLGRVKEMIHTRQGALVPTILDDNVQSTFNCEALVVSVPEGDGEFSVPVAVLKMPQRRIDSMARQASKRLHSYLGEHYVPVRYIAQERLGLRGQWPTNSSGKFVRGGLQDAVLNFLGQEEETCSSEEQE